MANILNLLSIRILLNTMLFIKLSTYYIIKCKEKISGKTRDLPKIGSRGLKGRQKECTSPCRTSARTK
jgi:hypothetical protein